ncbi:Type 1 phosphatases regulator ypi1 [Teratosphaeriaceae sp. CCFEE 6253]|nr:Type 1 phosphatases regulator ypi1 [Teratosphaeriaceae sp. CCFEE 6253]
MAQHPRSSVRSGTSTPTTIQTLLPDPTDPPATLHLRAGTEPRESGPSVRWAEDVVDNEGLGKKSSKVCCIYHKPHQPGDSDSEDSSSSSEDDEEPDLSRAQKAGGKGKGRRGHRHGDEDEGNAKGKGKERKPSPNAYERVPKQSHGKKEG